MPLVANQGESCPVTSVKVELQNPNLKCHAKSQSQFIESVSLNQSQQKLVREDKRAKTPGLLEYSSNPAIQIQKYNYKGVPDPSPIQIHKTAVGFLKKAQDKAKLKKQVRGCSIFKYRNSVALAY